MMPEKIGRYQVIKELGRGGMATVYRAHDPRFKRDVAVKLMPAQLLADATFRARFEREAQTIAALEHPAIVPVYDFGEEDGQPYLVMRFMPGGSLADKLANGHISPREASRVIARLASALDQVHTHGIVHRDLKPANVLFDQYGEAYLSDFGIARLTETTSSLTGDSIVGTPAYMSPEQARGEVDIDGRSDLYALGVILFQMLTGKQPYDAPTPIAVAMKHITDPVPRATDFCPDLSFLYNDVIEDAMAKERQDRFPTGHDLLTALEKAILRAESSTVELEDELVTAPYESIAESSSPVERFASSPGSSRPVTPSPGTSSPISQPDSQPVMFKRRRGVPIWAWIVIGILGIGLVCGLFILVLVIWEEVAPSSSPTATRDFHVSTQTALGMLTPDLKLTSTLMENTVEPVKTFVSGDVVLEDDFVDESSGWPTYQGENGFSRYQEQAYRIYIDKPNDRIEATLGTKLENVYLEVDASKAGGPDDNLLGLVCRYQDRKNFYLFVITSDGYYGVGKVVDGQYQLNGGGLQSSSEIKKGYATNSLDGECIDNEFKFWINDTMVAQFTDETFQTGDIGLLAGSYAVNGVDVLFDNFYADVP